MPQLWKTRKTRTDPQLFLGFHIASGLALYRWILPLDFNGVQARIFQTGFNLSSDSHVRLGIQIGCGSQIFCVVHSKLGLHPEDGFSSVIGCRFLFPHIYYGIHYWYGSHPTAGFQTCHGSHSSDELQIYIGSQLHIGSRCYYGSHTPYGLHPIIGSHFMSGLQQINGSYMRIGLQCYFDSQDRCGFHRFLGSYIRRGFSMHYRLAKHIRIQPLVRLCFSLSMVRSSPPDFSLDVARIWI